MSGETRRLRFQWQGDQGEKDGFQLRKYEEGLGACSAREHLRLTRRVYSMRDYLEKCWGFQDRGSAQIESKTKRSQGTTRLRTNSAYLEKRWQWLFCTAGCASAL